jgi:acyl-[acyl carrier protein]--UDP-N-acetylglucosamine O-acyltransferase
MGIVVSPTGAPVALETVTAFVHPGTTPAGTYATNSDGRWDADLTDETKQYRIEIGGGSGGTQRVVQAPASIELEYLFVRYGMKVVGGPVDLPVNTTIGGVTLDNRFVNITGDAMSGGLGIGGVLTQSGGYAYIGGYNTGVGPTYPRAGNDFGVGWNFTGRDISLWNTDTAAAFVSFGFRQLTGAGTRRDLLNLNSNGLVVVPSGGLTANGQVLAAGGSAGTPGFAFVGDENTGLFRNNEGQISMVSNGAIRLSSTTTGADVQGGLGVSGVMTVGSDAFLNSNLTVGGDMSVGGGLTLYGGVNVAGGNVGITNALTVGGSLTTSGQARFGSGVAPASAVMGVVRTLRIYDAAGTSLGYVPIYSGFNT